MSPFKIQHVIAKDIGNVTSTKRLRDGSLLIQVSSAAQAERLQALQLIGTAPVEVSPHRTLNSSKGVVYCPELMDLDVEEIAHEMKSQHVIEVQRINQRRDGELRPSPLHILTFNRVAPPENVFVGYIRLEVRKHVPNPLRCLRCQRYGHHQQFCKRPPVCDRCGKSNVHEGRPCDLDIQCANCEQPHTSWSRDCHVWAMEKKIQEIRTSEKLSYQEARQKYARIYPKPMSQSFSSVAASKPRETLSSSSASELSELRSMLATLLAGQTAMSTKLEEQSKQIEKQTAQIKELRKENIELRTRNTMMVAELEVLKSGKPEKRKKPSMASSHESVLSIEASGDSEMDLDVTGEKAQNQNSTAEQKFWKVQHQKGKKKKG